MIKKNGVCWVGLLNNPQKHKCGYVIYEDMEVCLQKMQMSMLMFWETNVTQ